MLSSSDMFKAVYNRTPTLHVSVTQYTPFVYTAEAPEHQSEQWPPEK